MYSKIIVLIPAYNAVHTIAEVIFKSKECAGKVIVYNDGSTDDTSYVASNCGAMVLEEKKNRGKGYALKRLFEYAKALPDAEESIFVTIDADMQHNPRDIPNLVKSILSGEFDVVCGVRQNSQIHRRIANKFLDMMSKNKESQMGLRAYSYVAIKDLQIETDGFGVDSEIMMRLSNFRTGHVSVWVEYDRYSHKKNPISHFVEVFNFLFFRRPLLNLGIFGLFLASVGLYFIFNVIQTFNAQKGLALGTFLGGMLLTILGTLIFFVGVILHAVKNTSK